MKSDSHRRDALLRELIAYLRSFEDEDREQGQRAAQNLQQALDESLQHRGSHPQPEGSADFWVGEVGSKGMLDWKWSESHQRQLEFLSEKIIRLSQPRWWEFWK
jgi:hypothetical protein